MSAETVDPSRQGDLLARLLVAYKAAGGSYDEAAKFVAFAHQHLAANPPVSVTVAGLGVVMYGDGTSSTLFPPCVAHRQAAAVPAAGDAGMFGQPLQAGGAYQAVSVPLGDATGVPGLPWEQRKTN